MININKTQFDSAKKRKQISLQYPPKTNSHCSHPKERSGTTSSVNIFFRERPTPVFQNFHHESLRQTLKKHSEFLAVLCLNSLISPFWLSNCHHKQLIVIGILKKTPYVQGIKRRESDEFVSIRTEIEKQYM